MPRGEALASASLNTRMAAILILIDSRIQHNSNIQSCMSSHLELLYCSWRSTSGFHYWTYKIILLYWKRKGIRIDLAMWKLLGLAGGNTKKHGNKKSGESRTPIRYNVMIHCLSIARSIHLVPASMYDGHGDHHTWMNVYMLCIRRNHHKTPTLNIQIL